MVKAMGRSGSDTCVVSYGRSGSLKGLPEGIVVASGSPLVPAYSFDQLKTGRKFSKFRVVSILGKTRRDPTR